MAPGTNHMKSELLASREVDHDPYNGGRLSDWHRQLIEEHWKRARECARAYGKRFTKRDLDWDGAAALGLCRAAHVFRPETGYDFSSQMVMPVRMATLRMVQQSLPAGYRYPDQRRTYGKGPTIEEIEADPMMADGLTCDCGPVGWELEAADAVLGLARKLSEPHSHVIRMLYLCADLAEQKAVAEVLGYSHNNISRLHKQSLARLREAVS